MTREELQSKVLEVVAEQIEGDLASIPLDKKFNELGVDSVDAMSIMFAVEEEFGISVPDGDAYSVDSVDRLVEVIAKTMETK